jgi:hypothetical protein
VVSFKWRTITRVPLLKGVYNGSKKGRLDMRKQPFWITVEVVGEPNEGENRNGDNYLELPVKVGDSEKRCDLYTISRGTLRKLNELRIGAIIGVKVYTPRKVGRRWKFTIYCFGKTYREGGPNLHENGHLAEKLKKLGYTPKGVYYEIKDPNSTLGLQSLKNSFSGETGRSNTNRRSGEMNQLYRRLEKEGMRK